MLQRIQTLFLLAAAGLMISMIFTPMYHTVNNETLMYYKDYTSIVLILVSCVVCITTICYFKKRVLQIRLCNLNTLILIGFQIFLAVKFFTREPNTVFSVTAVFPIVAAILTFIAMRYIARDEAMVISASRLRSDKKKK